MADPGRGLRPVIGLGGLLIYGIVVIQPTAPLGSFGVVSQVARGHVATALLIAMVAMVLTAISYGRMAIAYPSAGSAYTYVSRAVHPSAGFLVGWCIIMDYMLLPTIGTIWCAKAAMNIVALPYALYVVVFAVLFTAVNLMGIKLATRTNIVITVGLLAVLALFFTVAGLYIAQEGGGANALFSTRPFYDPLTFDWSAVATGASIGVLTYMGFDCISTLSEEVRNPRRTIPIATVLLCVITGALGTLQVYFGQLAWPDFTRYPDVDTAFVHIAGRVGGNAMFHLMNAALLVATIGSSLAAQMGASRLLYAMGRDGVLPPGFFGFLDDERRVPSRNILFIGVVIAIGALLLSYQRGAELVNFGAFVAFMGVNVAAIVHGDAGRSDRGLGTLLVQTIPPALGLVICALIWWSLRFEAKLAGFAWIAVGIGYAAWRTRGFRQPIGSLQPATVLS